MTRPPVPDEIGLLEGIATTRAIRRFTDEPVSDADLAAVFFAAFAAILHLAIDEKPVPRLALDEG